MRLVDRENLAFVVDVGVSAAENLQRDSDPVAPGRPENSQKVPSRVVRCVLVGPGLPGVRL